VRKFLKLLISVNCWDGTYKGEPLNSGVYAWTLNATLIDGTVVTKKGDVTLFR